ncbi:MAG: sulfatase-like hydrolase/transferase, partial [Planctomycetota bacterium]
MMRSRCPWSIVVHGGLLAVAGMGLACSGETPPPEQAPAVLLKTANGNPLPPDAGLLAPGDTRDLIVVSIDTLRADRLPFYGSERPTAGSATQPWNLNWLAAQGTTFDSLWAPTGVTLPSLATFWTGRSPLEHGAMGNRRPILIPGYGQQLMQAGWKGFAVTTNGVLMKGPAFRNEFDRILTRGVDSEAGLPKLLLPMAEDSIREGERLFLWAHYMSPHQPYAPMEPFAHRWSDPQGLEGSTENLHDLYRHPESATPEVIAQMRGLYDEEILGANLYLKRFLKKLDSQYRDAGRGGLLENAVLVFFSDHGEGLGDRRGFFMHAKSLYSGVIRVPCVIVGGGWEAGGRVEQGVALQDVLPMVLEGRSPTSEVFFSSIRDEYFSARDARWTLIHNPSEDAHGPVGPPSEVPWPLAAVALYDRDSDPLERVDVSKEHPQVTRRLLDALHEWYVRI